MMLLGLIGVAVTVAVIVLVRTLVSGNSGSTPEQAEAKLPSALAQPADSGKKVVEVAAEKRPSTEQEPDNWNMASVDPTTVGNVVLKVLNPTRGAPPEGAKTDDAYEVLDRAGDLGTQSG